MGLLNEMARLLGEQTVTVTEYEDLFGLLLRASDLGHIPQTLDAVVLAGAGKMRLDDPDYVFVLGLAEGEFPHGSRRKRSADPCGPRMPRWQMRSTCPTALRTGWCASRSVFIRH